MREAFLQEHRPALYQELKRTGKLSEHLAEVNASSCQRLEIMMPALTNKAGATEELKARDQMEWVRRMNACKAQAEEVIFAEIVYV